MSESSVPGPSCPVLPGWTVLVKEGLPSTLSPGGVNSQDRRSSATYSELARADAVGVCAAELRLLSVEHNPVLSNHSSTAELISSDLVFPICEVGVMIPGFPAMLGSEDKGPEGINSLCQKFHCSQVSDEEREA